jgi:limonene-1,2-epoxide hydrolase
MAEIGTLPTIDTTPVGVVQSFLLALQANDVEGAVALLADDVRWINVSLPTLRGPNVARVLRALEGRSGFRVHFFNIAAEGDVVLTERTDAIRVGRFEQRFWVWGRFEVRDGRIAVWRDSFDWLDITVSVLRGAAGVVVPALNRSWPGTR